MNKKPIAGLLFIFLLLLIALLATTNVHASLSQNASGGTMSTVLYNGSVYTVHTFTANGTFTYTGIPGNVEVLVIAGGGGGGADNAGGGGAGGLRYDGAFSVTGNTVVVVGTGGAGGITGSTYHGRNGTNSSFGSLMSWGGGGGTAYNTDTAPNGYNGGSGGGAGAECTAGSVYGGTGAAGQGYGGGNTSLSSCNPPYTGAGGGGAGGSGQNATTSTGGIGLTYNLTGTPTCYAGGGGGGGNTGAGTATCGGGAGRSGAGAGTAGAANTGGGGGGGGNSGGGPGGDGGSGIVIVRYTIAARPLFTLSVNDTRTGSLVAGFNYTYATTNASDAGAKNGYCSTTSCEITNYTGSLNLTITSVDGNYFLPFDSPKNNYVYNITQVSATFQTYGLSLNVTNITNRVNGSTISNYCVSLSNSTNSRSNCTTNGNATIGKVYQPTTLLVYNITGGTYFNLTQTVTGYNDTTGVYSNSTYQALLSFAAHQLFTNNSIMSFNASTGRLSNTTTSGTLLLPANNGSNTVTVNVSGNYSKTLTCTITTPLSTGSCNVTGIYDDLYTIGAKTIAGAGLSTFTVNVSNSTLGGALYSQATTNGSLVFPVLQGYNYYVLMQPSGYAWDNKTLAGNASTQLYNFSVYTSNSFNFTFLYEENRTTITGVNITLEMIGELESYNYTTSNGLLYVDLLTPETYTLRYGGNGFLTRFYRYTLSNNTFQYLNLTLCTTSTCSNVTINVLDSIGNPLEGAIVKIKKFNLPTNDYPIMEIVETNFEGQAQAGIEVNNEFYIFVIEYEDQVVYTSEKTYVYGDSLTFQVSLRASGFETVFTNQNLQGNVTFSNSTNTGTFRYNDVSNTATQSCLYAYRLTRTGKTLYNSTCSSSSSGTITVLVLNESGRAYSLEGYMTTGGSTYLVDSELYTYTAYLPETQRGFGLLIGFIIIVVFIFVVRFSLELAAIVPGVIMLFVSIAQLWTVSVEASVSVLIMGIIVAYFVGFRK